MPIQAEVEEKPMNVNRASADTLAKMAPDATQRISALDFTKGALVLIMVLYHWINYFIGPQWPYYFYLRFLTPSFIFITGFMISHVYLSKYKAADPRLPRRLFVRGLKLMAIFVVLNVARVFIVPILHTGALVNNPLDLKNIFTIFVSGNLSVVSGKLVSFSILVPISYLLMFSGALMFPYRVFKYTFHVTSALLLLCALALGWMGAGSQNLEFVAIGMLGELTGFLPLATINNFVRRPYLLALAYFGYVAAITLWNVPFSLLIVGVYLSLMFIYLIGVSGTESDKTRSTIILLGKYSLFGYLSQIFILQILSVGLRSFNNRIAVQVISFGAAFALTIASVELVDRMRVRAANIDKLYKAVFA